MVTWELQKAKGNVTWRTALRTASSCALMHVRHYREVESGNLRPKSYPIPYIVYCFWPRPIGPWFATHPISAWPPACPFQINTLHRRHTLSASFHHTSDSLCYNQNKTSHIFQKPIKSLNPPRGDRLVYLLWVVKTVQNKVPLIPKLFSVPQWLVNWKPYCSSSQKIAT